MENKPKRHLFQQECTSQYEKAKNMRKQSDFWESIDYTFSITKPKGNDMANVQRKEFRSLVFKIISSTKSIQIKR